MAPTRRLANGGRRIDYYDSLTPYDAQPPFMPSEPDRLVAKYVVQLPEQIAEDETEEEKEAAEVPAPISYRSEFRQQGQTIYTFNTEKPVSEFAKSVGDIASVFDVVTEFDCDRSEMTYMESAKPVFYIGSLQGRRRLDIRSPAIIRALQKVVTYWPGCDLSAEVVQVGEPYRLLVHHSKELQQYQERSSALVEKCANEINANEHLSLLKDYLTQNIMPEIELELERNSRGFATFEYLWLLLKPGTEVVVKAVESARSFIPYRCGRVVKSVEGGPGEYKGGKVRSWEIKLYFLCNTGSTLEIVHETRMIEAFEGEREVTSLDIIPANWPGHLVDGKPWTSILQEQGRKTFALATPQCAQHTGKALEFPHDELDGLVMIDMKAFYAQCPEKRPKGEPLEQQTSGIPHCDCPTCIKRSEKRPESHLHSYTNIKIGKSTLTDHQAFIYSTSIFGFHFRTRSWEHIDVANLTPAQFQTDILDTSLVMKAQRTNMLKALSKKYMRSADEVSMQRAEFWSADFIEGKGKSQIILLHGRPGVGKTYTAECIAEYTRRPLLTLTSADIGTSSEYVEDNLMFHFTQARDWGAIVLIDEADIYMERRSNNDLDRNGLVAGFLRALETFEGMLFLTTNRVGAFDDAFTSRIHVKLYYPPLQNDDRQKIWESFIKKLSRERMKSIRVTVGAKEYIKGPAIRNLDLNGREIRNAFQTAVALAEHEQVLDEEGTICVQEHHIEQVADMTREFQVYLDELHEGNEEKRAKRVFERSDQAVDASGGAEGKRT